MNYDLEEKGFYIKFTSFFIDWNRITAGFIFGALF